MQNPTHAPPAPPDQDRLNAATDPADEPGDLDAALAAWQALFAPTPGTTLGGVAR